MSVAQLLLAIFAGASAVTFSVFLGARLLPSPHPGVQDLGNGTTAKCVEVNGHHFVIFTYYQSAISAVEVQP